MVRRNKWGHIIRALHEHGCSRLAMTMARHRTFTKRAIVHKVMGGCSSVNPGDPETLSRVISQNCVKGRWVEAERRFERSPTQFLNSANLGWGERRLWGRLLLKVGFLRKRYLEFSRRRTDPYSVTSMLRRKRLVKKAKAKRRPWYIKLSNGLLRAVTLTVASVATGVYVVGDEGLAVETKTELLVLVKNGLKALFSTF